jgi:hypothetical protein
MTKKQQINEWEEKIKQIVSNYNNLTERCNIANNAGVLDMEGLFYHSIWATFDDMLNIVDSNDWISWYIFDNDYGTKKMQAGYDGLVSKIATPRQLAKLIVEGENRNANPNAERRYADD